MDILQLEKVIEKTALEMGFKVSINEKFKNDGYLVCNFFHIKTGEKCCLKLALDEPTNRFVSDLRYYLTSFKQFLGVSE